MTFAIYSTVKCYTLLNIGWGGGGGAFMYFLILLDSCDYFQMSLLEASLLNICRQHFLWGAGGCILVIGLKC